MINRRSLYVVFVAMVILFFTIFAGCAKPPTEEMTKAEKAVEEAKQKEAPVYVPDLFTKAEESLNKAKDYIVGKKYKEAKQVALETETLAKQAIAGFLRPATHRAGSAPGPRCDRSAARCRTAGLRARPDTRAPPRRP